MTPTTTAHPAAELVPDTDTIFDWVETVFARGIRRPGYPADQWCEQWAAERFEEIGLEDVHLEPVEVKVWDFRTASLTVWPTEDPSAAVELPAFALPYSLPTEGSAGPLVPFEPGTDPTGSVAVANLRLMELPQSYARTLATSTYDPDDDFETLVQTLPFGEVIENVLGDIIEAGAAGYVGILDMPWETHDYYLPHNLLFLLNAGHMAGGAGTGAFTEAHRQLLDRTVLAVHLEHAAAECRAEGDDLVPTGDPEVRWWFTTQEPVLEAAVADALAFEDLRRSLVLRPDVFFEFPPTDGGFFHTLGVPLVNYLTAPMYLVDSCDTLDKVHRPSLTAVTRATIRIIISLAGRSAADLRATSITQSVASGGPA